MDEQTVQVGQVWYLYARREAVEIVSIDGDEVEVRSLFDEALGDGRTDTRYVSWFDRPEYIRLPYRREGV